MASNKSTESDVEQPKHPLEHSWAFWFFTNENKKNWLENLVELTEFDTVEDYWCLYHYMKFPSELRNGQDYAVFKKGINPMWEDPNNKAGGRWLINVDKKAADLDRIWLDVVLLMIGENFSNANEIVCGAVVNFRGRGHKISIWTRTTEENAIMAIGKKIKGQIKLNRLQFSSHDSTAVLYNC